MLHFSVLQDLISIFFHSCRKWSLIEKLQKVHTPVLKEQEQVEEGVVLRAVVQRGVVK